MLRPAFPSCLWGDFQTWLSSVFLEVWSCHVSSRKDDIQDMCGSHFRVSLRCFFVVNGNIFLTTPKKTMFAWHLRFAMWKSSDVEFPHINVVFFRRLVISKAIKHQHWYSQNWTYENFLKWGGYPQIIQNCVLSMEKPINCDTHILGNETPLWYWHDIYDKK